MANRFPLIVDSSSQQIKELPDGDSLLLGDSEKLILGDGSDLQIFHDGNSKISDGNSSSDLLIQSNNIVLEKTDGENMIHCSGDGAVQLYYDNSAKLATASGGVTVTGQMKATQSAYIEQVALTSGTNVTWNADTQGNAYLLLGHNVTIGKASNGNEGQIIQVEIAQPGSGGPYTVAWNTDYEFAASTAPTMTATASKTDIFTFRYNGDVWQEIGRVQNMAQT
jgi:hypothetical protein